MLLQQPGQMGSLRLKNRVVMGPMGTNFGTTSGFSTEHDKIYYAERALACRLGEAGAARGWGLDAALKTPKCGCRTV
jgi:2,4-dienoyl-CoA reductase-like NADH-dependent reductase (Old Yellow Enzyme family)